MKRIILPLILLFLSFNSIARTSSDVRALFIYQFTKLIEWPKETQSGMFRIGVVGSFNSYKEIMDLAMGRNVGNQNIEVMNIMNINQVSLSDFHILLVGEKYCTPENLKKINNSLKSRSTLVVAEKLNYKGDGVCICFEGNNTDFKYIYTYPSIKQKGLKCSQDFLLLGKKVD